MRALATAAEAVELAAIHLDRIALAYDAQDHTALNICVDLLRRYTGEE